jgi:hypothetical protein
MLMNATSTTSVSFHIGPGIDITRRKGLLFLHDDPPLSIAFK